MCCLQIVTQILYNIWKKYYQQSMAIKKYVEDEKRELQRNMKQCNNKYFFDVNFIQEQTQQKASNRQKWSPFAKCLDFIIFLSVSSGRTRPVCDSQVSFPSCGEISIKAFRILCNIKNTDSICISAISKTKQMSMPEIR